MGPGPSDVHPRVLGAMARPTIGHLDPEFSRMMEEVKELLRYAFKTKNALTIPVSGPGSVGMETCFVNLVEAGDTVIVCQNGAFGGRMKLSRAVPSKAVSPGITPARPLKGSITKWMSEVSSPNG